MPTGAPDALGLAADDHGDVLDAACSERLGSGARSASCRRPRRRHFGLSPIVPFSREPLPAARMIPRISLGPPGPACAPHARLGLRRRPAAAVARASAPSPWRCRPALVPVDGECRRTAPDTARRRPPPAAQQPEACRMRCASQDQQRAPRRPPARAPARPPDGTRARPAMPDPPAGRRPQDEHRRERDGISVPKA